MNRSESRSQLLTNRTGRCRDPRVGPELPTLHFTPTDTVCEGILCWDGSFSIAYISPFLLCSLQILDLNLENPQLLSFSDHGGVAGAVAVADRIGGAGGKGPKPCSQHWGEGFPHLRTASKVDETLDRAAEEGHLPLFGYYSPRDFVLSLRRPRSVIILVKAGDPVDYTIDALSAHMEPGDAIIDGSDTWYQNTERRIGDTVDKGLLYLGMGISGGEEGARFGPSLMPGGSLQAYQNIEDIVKKVAAQVEGDGPCVTYIGEGGSGSFVRMVHSALEYVDRQLISEAYGILKNVGGCCHEELAEVLEDWKIREIQGPRSWRDLEGALQEVIYLCAQPAQTSIVATVRHGFQIEVDSSEANVEKLEEVVRFYEAADWKRNGTMDEMKRLLIKLKEKRGAAIAALKEAERKEVAPVSGIDKRRLMDDVRQALYASTICSYAQGMELLRAKSVDQGWNLKLGEVARIWKGGLCIVRAAFLDKIKQAYQRNPNLASLVFDPELAREMLQRVAALKRVVSLASSAGISTPVMSASLNYRAS